MSVPPTGAIHVRPLLHIPGGISIAPTVASACSRGGGTFISFYVTVRRFLFAGRRSQRFLQLPGRRPTSRHSGTRHKTHGGDCAIAPRTFPGLLADEKKAKNRFFFLVALSQDGGGGGGYGRAADASYILLRVSYNGVNAPYF